MKVQNIELKHSWFPYNLENLDIWYRSVQILRIPGISSQIGKSLNKDLDKI